MATVTPTSVKDVPRDKFITAYAEHLKANDKVRLCSFVGAFGWIVALCHARRSRLSRSMHSQPGCSIC